MRFATGPRRTPSARAPSTRTVTRLPRTTRRTFSRRAPRRGRSAKARRSRSSRGYRCKWRAQDRWVFVPGSAVAWYLDALSKTSEAPLTAWDCWEGTISQNPESLAGCVSGLEPPDRP